MFRAVDFIRWALTHVKPATIPSGATLALPVDECGTEPWEYLFGSVRVMTTQATLDYYFNNYYSKHGYTRARYDELTRNWDRHGYATDCQGLCDAYLTFEAQEPTDINADMNYRLWCTDKGTLAEIDRPYVIGEALFHSNGDRMTHVGWICGFDRDGEPLAVEARGIAFGVVVTRLDGRSWTHRGLMTKVFDYKEADMIRFEVTSPMHTGMTYAKMQDVLNEAGYTDYDDRPLEADGKWGKRSQSAFDKLIADYAPEAEPEEPEPGVEIKPVAIYTVGRDNELTTVIFRSEDLEEVETWTR